MATNCKNSQIMHAGGWRTQEVGRGDGKNEKNGKFKLAYLTVFTGPCDFMADDLCIIFLKERGW
jgi:hypothetical protein